MSLHSVAAGTLGRLPFPVQRAALHRLGRYAPWEEEFDFTPPTPAPGDAAGPPDFVGIGVQKAGTTWWYNLVVDHPEVSAPAGIHKERHFLSQFRYGLEGFGPEDVAAYHGWFPRPPGTRCGEFTPDYLYQPWVPTLLRQAAPDTRLLLILRDPVERLLSGLAHQLRFGARRSAPTLTEAIDRGSYVRPLERWLAAWDAEQLLVLQYERCREQPEEELARTYRHLGLHDAYRPANLRRPVSPSESSPMRLDPDARRRLVDLYTPVVTALPTLVPGLDLGLWPNFSHLASA
jgi:hypothetical protein